jgi:hypothetical protein
MCVWVWNCRWSIVSVSERCGVGRVVESGRWFGPHGDLVGAFLDEVASRSVDWVAFTQHPRGPQRLAATQAITEVRWPAALIDAVGTAGLRTYGSLGLSRSDFADPLHLGRVKRDIGSASKAIAAGGKLAAEHRRVLLVPFVEAGFVSAAEALRVLDGVEVPGGGSVVEE